MFEHIVHIEKKDWEVTATAERLLASLREADCSETWLSLGDAVSRSGIPRHLCEPAFVLLGGAIGADVRVASDEVEFYFDSLETEPGLLRYPRAIRPWVHKLESVGASLLDYAAVAVTSLIGTVTGVVYCGLIWASDMDQELKSNLVGLLGLVTTVVALPSIGLLLILVTIVGLIAAFVIDPNPGNFCGVLCWIPPFAVLAWLSTGAINVTRRFNRMMASRLSGLFNFGRERVDELSDERNFVAVVAASQGRVTVRDLVALFGWNVQRAHDQLTRLLLDYGGDIEVTDDGIMVFVFEALQEADEVEPPEPVWLREKEPMQVYRDNHGVASDVIAGLVFIVGAVGLYGGLVELAVREGTGLRELISQAPAYLQAATFLIAGLLLALPLYQVVRQVILRRRQDRYAERERFLELVELAVESPNGIDVDPDRFSNKDLAALDADIDPEAGGEGEIRVEFPTLRAPSRRGQSETVHL